jgi:AcrR family transcriptional regulator
VSSTKPVRRTSAETREHVLAVAHQLFYWQGVRAIGVDKVAAEAGIAPTTLYRLFASKDELIAAYIENAYRDYRDWFSSAVEAGGDDPRDRIRALFDAQQEMLRPEVCRGCPFMMVLTEFPDDSLIAHQQSVAMKRWVRQQFGQLTAALEIPDHDQLADHLTLIFEGAYASAQALGSTGPATGTRSLVEALLS